jgi:hypothetical protein
LTSAKDDDDGDDIPGLCDSDDEPASGSDMGDSDDEGVSDVDMPPRAVTVDLSKLQLDSLFDNCTAESKYSTNGVCAKRIKKALKKGCKCSKVCFKSLTYRSLNDACRGFWRLGKTAQDAILWSMGRISPGKRRSWKLNSTPVCREGFCTALGIGRTRRARVTRTFRGYDLRGEPG